jgi:hypothetical protein
MSVSPLKLRVAFFVCGLSQHGTSSETSIGEFLVRIFFQKKEVDPWTMEDLDAKGLYFDEFQKMRVLVIISLSRQ